MLIFSFATLSSRQGVLIGRYPAVFILTPVILTCFGVYGFLHQPVVTSLEALWIPKGSRAAKEREWVDAHFPKDFRVEQVMFLAQNVSFSDDDAKKLGNSDVRGEHVKGNVLNKDVLLLVSWRPSNFLSLSP